MKYLAIVLFLSLLSACTGLREWAANQGKAAAKEFLEREGPPLIEAALVRIVPEEAAKWKVEADASGDGTTSLEEWWMWITGGGLVTVLGFLMRKITGTKEEIQLKESRKRTEQWEAIGAAEQKLHDIELRLASSSSTSP